MFSSTIDFRSLGFQNSVYIQLYDLRPFLIPRGLKYLVRFYTPCIHYSTQRRQISLLYTRNRRSVSNNRSTKSSIAITTTTMKEIILVKRPSENEVTKYGKKSELHRRGFIMDAVEVDKNWSEEELRNRLGTMFGNKLNGVGLEPHKRYVNTLTFIFTTCTVYLELASNYKGSNKYSFVALIL